MHIEIEAAPLASGAMRRAAMALSVNITSLELLLLNVVADPEQR